MSLSERLLYSDVGDWTNGKFGDAQLPIAPTTNTVSLVNDPASFA